MEYRDRSPVTKSRRSARRKTERKITNQKQEANRQRARTEKPDELGVIQGQNGEQGNTVDPRQARDIGRTSQH